MKGLPSGLVLRTWPVEYLLQPSFKPELYTPNQNNCICRWRYSATRGKTVIEAVNITNTELTKIAAWATANKIHFNEQKSKTMLLSRRKRKDRKDLEIYLNYRPITQVASLKYYLKYSQQWHREVRAGQWEKRKGKKSMPLSYGRGEEFYEFLGQRGERIFQFWRKWNPKDH